MERHDTQSTFDSDAATRLLADVFAEWVRDLGLSVVAVETSPAPGAVSDWLPGAVLRMPFSERLCRQGGVVCGQALMALMRCSEAAENGDAGHMEPG